jgi:hypothetical protein
MTDVNLDKAPTPQIVRITQMAGDTVPLDYDATLTLGDYLARAQITVGAGEVVTLNGAPAELDVVPAPDSVVVVTGKIRNG